MFIAAERGTPARLGISASRSRAGGILREYARQRGLKRAMIRVPVLTPRLSSWWLRLVTPLQARVGRQLIEGVRHATVVSNDLALRTFAIRPAGIRQAIADALRAEDREFSATRWSHARSMMLPHSPWGGIRIGNHLLVSQTIDVKVPPAAAFAPIRRIGGAVGWYYGRWLWELRAFADRLLGGSRHAARAVQRGNDRGRRPNRFLACLEVRAG